jgi:ribosome-binding protein aMBF1 (putative translation factor)
VFTGVFAFQGVPTVKFFNMAGPLACSGSPNKTKAVNTTTNESRAVRTARQRRRWTQLELARRVGCSESQVAKIETGRVTEIVPWLKEAIARELGIQTWEVGQ